MWGINGIRVREDGISLRAMSEYSIEEGCSIISFDVLVKFIDKPLLQERWSDLCKDKIIASDNFEVDEVVVSHRTGESYPESGGREIDIQAR